MRGAVGRCVAPSLCDDDLDLNMILGVLTLKFGVVPIEGEWGSARFTAADEIVSETTRFNIARWIPARLGAAEHIIRSIATPTLLTLYLR
jgi:hypothetical protein